MFTGMLNKTMGLYRSTDVPDSVGGTTEVWLEEQADVPCRVRALSGSERAMLGSTGVDVSHRVYCRPLADVNEKDEFRDGDVYYRITHVNDVDKASHHMEIDCQELRRG